MNLLVFSALLASVAHVDSAMPTLTMASNMSCEQGQQFVALPALPAMSGWWAFFQLLLDKEVADHQQHAAQMDRYGHSSVNATTAEKMLDYVIKQTATGAVASPPLAAPAASAASTAAASFASFASAAVSKPPTQHEPATDSQFVTSVAAAASLAPPSPADATAGSSPELDAFIAHHAAAAAPPSPADATISSSPELDASIAHHAAAAAPTSAADATASRSFDPSAAAADSPPSTSSSVQYFLRFAGKSLLIRGLSTDDRHSIRQHLWALHGVNCGDSSIQYAGKVLGTANYSTIVDLGVKNDSTIQVVARGVGGGSCDIEAGSSNEEQQQEVHPDDMVVCGPVDDHSDDFGDDTSAADAHDDGGEGGSLTQCTRRRSVGGKREHVKENTINAIITKLKEDGIYDSLIGDVLVPVLKAFHECVVGAETGDERNAAQIWLRLLKEPSRTLAEGAAATEVRLLMILNTRRQLERLAIGAKTTKMQEELDAVEEMLPEVCPRHTKHTSPVLACATPSCAPARTDTR